MARKECRRLMRVRDLHEFTREMLNYQVHLIAQRDVQPRGIRPGRESGFHRF